MAFGHTVSCIDRQRGSLKQGETDLGNDLSEKEPFANDDAPGRHVQNGGVGLRIAPVQGQHHGTRPDLQRPGLVGG